MLLRTEGHEEMHVMPQHLKLSSLLVASTAMVGLVGHSVVVLKGLEEAGFAEVGHGKVLHVIRQVTKTKEFVGNKSDGRRAHLLIRRYCVLQQPPQ